MRAPLIAAILVCVGSVAQADIVSSGTGFIVNEDGDIVTNQHVILLRDDSGAIQYCAGLQIVGHGFSGAAEIVGDAPRQDLAVLRFVELADGGRPPRVQSPAAGAAPPSRGGWRNVVEATAHRSTDRQSSENGPAFAVFAADRPAPGEPVVAYGYPFSDVLSDEPKVSTGIVSSLSGVANNVNNLQHTAPINPGNSGGPLLDANARVIGVNSARLAIDAQQNTNFAIHGAVVTQLLDSLAVTYRREGGGAPASVPDIARRANAFTVKVLCHR
ncbi:MAG: trypsin-like peptidase domain-containing protein [Alphaproteobacteria bacterium]|nr:trypsin-like peptidase domain-containing protein [Alphaproteobacteria bacterium]